MSMAAPPPIPGESVDPPPREVTETLAKIQDRTSLGAILYRAILRFNGAHSLLLAAGTTYFIFLSIFSLLALAFGLVALLGSQELSDFLTRALDESLPGLVGSGRVDPEQLRLIGQSTSLLGFVAFLYSGSGMMGAVSSGLHLIYGAPKDPRPFLLMKARLLGWLFLVAPLVVMSFAPSLLVARFADPVLEFIGIDGNGWVQSLTLLAAYSLSLVLNAAVLYLLLGHLGGIMPDGRSRLIGAGVGAVGMEALRFGATWVVSWAVARPQYGAFAVPIAMMLVFYLHCLVLYFSASLVTALAEHRGGDVPDSMTAQGDEDGPFPGASPDPEAETATTRDALPSLPQQKTREPDSEAAGKPGLRP